MRLVRSLRRRRLARRPFPAAWQAIVEQRLPFAARLAPEDAERFRTHLKVFAWDKRFEGAGGFVVDDVVKVVVSGAAARLSRNLSLDVWDDLGSVVVYPSHLKLPAEHDDGGGGVLFGLAHRFGTVVLSWDAVKHGIAISTDGHDTALHEFAHVLDAADGDFDGTPPLDRPSEARAWARVFSRHFLALKQRPFRHEVLRAYGAKNEAEFFAVATESFFEKGAQMKKKAPDLYEELARFYGVRPAG